MKPASLLAAVLLLLVSGAAPSTAAQTTTPIPNDPACQSASQTKWLDIINARQTLQRLFGPNPPVPLVSEVTILFVGTPIKSHPDLDPNVRADLEVNFNPNGDRPDDLHETSVASVAVARTHNAFGVCSVVGDGGVKAASAIIVDSNGVISGNGMRSAIRYAIDKKKAGESIEIVALAFFGGDDNPEATRRLLHEARDNGLIIVQAAGTQSTPIDLTGRDLLSRYAAEFTNVILVTALDSEGIGLDPTANFGRIVQIAAAGQVTVVSFLDPQNGGAGASGSSMGVGQVAGALALIKRYKERDYRLAIDRFLFAASAKPVAGIGGGKLDVDTAFTCAAPDDVPEFMGRQDDQARLAVRDAATWTEEPFALTNIQNLHPTDKRTRLALEVRGLVAGDNETNVTVHGTDSQGQPHTFTVEAVGRNQNSACLWQINVILPGTLPSGDLRLSVTARGKSRGSKLVRIQ